MKCTTQGMDIRVEFYSPFHCAGLQNSRRQTLQQRKSGSGQITRNGQSGLFGGSRTNRAEIFYIESSCQSGNRRHQFPYHRRQRAAERQGLRHLFADKNDAGTPSHQVRGSFLLDKDEPIYGVGQVMDGKFNRRNSMHHMQNENMFTYSPYFMSPVKGYAVYWDNYSISEFMDTPGTRFPEPGTLCGLLFHVWRKRRRHHRPGARLDGTLPCFHCGHMVSSKARSAIIRRKKA